MQTFAFIPTAVLVAMLAVAGCDTMESEPVKKSPKTDAAPTHTNRLAREKSPYLLQHARNPVDWYPWGDEAFAKASRDDKPVFLSIGYATCHWCHVMEAESFEDAEVAKLMNDTFVSIKVDREERPDLDAIYMTVCQGMTGSGGWPLTVLLTPERKPFFAATYIPRTSRGGRAGMMELIPAIGRAWKERRAELLEDADGVVAFLEKQSAGEPGDALDAGTLKLAYEQFAARFDRVHGGFGSRPKFPTPHNLLFLLRWWKRSGDKHALEMVERTLESMRLGGIFDHVGFGFHRYATDDAWLVPHFEKMLYDQAMLALAYTEAFQATGKPEYERTAREILTCVLRDMTSPEGAFTSAEDADSPSTPLGAASPSSGEGEEGKFYVWTAGEIRSVLDPDEARFVVETFGVRDEGNWRDEATGEPTGTNILHLRGPLDDGARARWQPIRRMLFAAREKRVRPRRDDKVLTDWNGLMIAALATAARTFDEPRYAEAAERAADFVLATLRTPDGRLLHRYRDGDAAVGAFAEDYAFLVHGLVELYETTFDVRRLETAIALNDDFLAHFRDAASGGFFHTADDAETLLVRTKQSYDGAVPSGNSVAALNLIRLARLTGNAALESEADRTVRAFSSDIARAPVAFTQWLVAVDSLIGPSHEIVIVPGSGKADDTRAMLRALRSRFLPNKVVLLRTDDVVRLAPYTAAQTSLDGRATAYVCRDFACTAPTTDVTHMLERLDAPNRP
ncbi:MAG TPA: thioredoxin domain-containing protein [Planctomycetota bacterium]|nr:thioredoxin domain-containing protein [Planctomycetota bacterium]